MDRVSSIIKKLFDYVGSFAGGLDETQWAALGLVSVVAGLIMLKGRGIKKV